MEFSGKLKHEKKKEINRLTFTIKKRRCRSSMCVYACANNTKRSLSLSLSARPKRFDTAHKSAKKIPYSK